MTKAIQIFLLGILFACGETQSSNNNPHTTEESPIIVDKNVDSLSCMTIEAIEFKILSNNKVKVYGEVVDYAGAIKLAETVFPKNSSSSHSISIKLIGDSTCNVFKELQSLARRNNIHCLH